MRLRRWQLRGGGVLLQAGMRRVHGAHLKLHPRRCVRKQAVPLLLGPAGGAQDRATTSHHIRHHFISGSRSPEQQLSPQNGPVQELRERG